MKRLVNGYLASITLARHGNAAKKTEGGTDRERALTEHGRRQSHGLRDALRGATFDFVGSSPLTRAMEMSRISTGDEPIEIIELGVNEDPHDPINIMFADLVYSPLVASAYDPKNPESKPGYYQHHLGEHLKSWARETIEVILAKAEDEAESLDRPVHIFIGGHAVCHPALADALAEQISEVDSNLAAVISSLVQAYNLGEAEAIKIVLPADGAQGSCEIIKPLL